MRIINLDKVELTIDKRSEKNYLQGFKIQIVEPLIVLLVD